MDSFTTLPVKQIDDVLRLPGKAQRTLGYISRTQSEDAVKAFLVLTIGDMLDFFSVGNSMNASQVKQTVMLILEDYQYLTVDDFKVFFNNCKKGIYGTSYNRIDGNVILGWLKKYEDERFIAAASLSEQEGFSQKDRFQRRGDIQRVADLEIEKIFGNKILK